MSTYELKTNEFSGPLEKLLELIEAKELEITKISLAEVTADFVGYINSVGNLDPRTLSDFVSVASKLILIKSHTLLPQLSLTTEEEGEIADLEDRLRIYREFKAAQKNIKAMWGKNVSYSRDFLVGSVTGFSLSQELTTDDLRAIVEKLCGELTAIFPKIERGEVKLINFEEKVQELLARVRSASTSKFSEISDGRGKMEIIILFLAILHLLKDSLIKIEQKGEFEDITITKS